MQPFDWQTNSPFQHLRKCVTNSVENMHTDVRVKRVYEKKKSNRLSRKGEKTWKANTNPPKGIYVFISEKSLCAYRCVQGLAYVEFQRRESNFK